MYLQTHPDHAQDSDLYYQHQQLTDLDPALGMQGAGVWADAATVLQKMDDFVVQHPKLSALMSHAGSIAGGAMWLKNLTPAGLASYLLANYGYNKIIKLAGGSLEKGKERLAQFFIKHDQEITSEQAAYLANFAMTLLTDVGGRMVFHQVAAKGFSVGRKGVGRGLVKRQGRDGEGVVKLSNMPVVKEKIWSNTIQQTFKNLGSLKGVGTREANEILRLNGFVFQDRTPGGYYKYYHPN